jgi:hypothetical protein
MNERIKELAEQANYLATEKEFPYDADWFYLYNKKFAELIVKECAEVAAAAAVEHDALDIYEEIREHFGVKE